MGAGAQGIESSPAAFSSPELGAELGVESWDMNCHPYGLLAPGQKFSLPTMSPAPLNIMKDLI